MDVKVNLINAKTSLKMTMDSFNEIDCECDDYYGYGCILCDWKMRLRRLREEVGIALGNED